MNEQLNQQIDTLEGLASPPRGCWGREVSYRNVRDETFLRDGVRQTSGDLLGQTDLVSVIGASGARR